MTQSPGLHLGPLRLNQVWSVGIQQLMEKRDSTLSATMYDSLTNTSSQTSGRLRNWQLSVGIKTRYHVTKIQNVQTTTDILFCLLSLSPISKYKNIYNDLHRLPITHGYQHIYLFASIEFLPTWILRPQNSSGKLPLPQSTIYIRYQEISLGYRPRIQTRKYPHDSDLSSRRFNSKFA